jgi:hypothetical protein
MLGIPPPLAPIAPSNAPSHVEPPPVSSAISVDACAECSPCSA